MLKKCCNFGGQINYAFAKYLLQNISYITSKVWDVRRHWIYNHKFSLSSEISLKEARVTSPWLEICGFHRL